MAAIVRSNRSSSGDGWVTRGGVRLSRAVTIDASPEHLYEVWGDLGRLPSVMSHIERVETLDVGISRWHARAPAGGTVTWTAEVVTDVPAQRIAWRTRPGSDVRHEGEVRFEPAPAGQGTEVHVDLRYWPPAGQLGATVARLLGEEPRQQLADDLRHLREVLETGSRARSAAPLDEPRLLQRPSQPVFVGRS
jgi:uncharacterized membrane protein